MPPIGPPEYPSDDPDDADVEVRREPQVPGELEATLIAILKRPLREGEGHAEGHQAKERDLRAELATLTAIDAYAVQRRLDRDDPADELAVLFGRMLVERRTRLLGLLVEIRRRASIHTP